MSMLPVTPPTKSPMRQFLAVDFPIDRLVIDMPLVVIGLYNQDN